MPQIAGCWDTALGNPVSVVVRCEAEKLAIREEETTYSRWAFRPGKEPAEHAPEESYVFVFAFAFVALGGPSRYSYFNSHGMSVSREA